MKGILLVSHGKLAAGMKDTVELFSGKVEQLEALELAPSQDINEFSQLLKDKITEIDSGTGVVVFCDLAFGTPSNLVGRLLGEEQFRGKIQLITGMNLPMVLEYTQVRKSSDAFDEVIKIGKEGIIDFNEKLKK